MYLRNVLTLVIVAIIFPIVSMYNRDQDDDGRNYRDERPYTISWDFDRNRRNFLTYKHRYGVPFLRREVELDFHKEFEHQYPTIYDQKIQSITHYDNLLDPDCKLNIKITYGGIDYFYARILITSAPGCGIDSIIGIITEEVPTKVIGRF